MDTTPHEAVRGDLGLQLLSSCAARSTRAGLRRVLFLAEFTDPGGLDVAPAPFHPFARPGGTFLFRILWQFLFFFHFLMSFLGSSYAPRGHPGNHNMHGMVTGGGGGYDHKYAEHVWSPPLYTFFMVAETFSFIALAGIILIVLLSRTVSRSTAWVHFCITWLMFAFAFLLPLLGPSRAPGADPSALCMVAAILRFAVYPLCACSMLAFTVDMWFAVVWPTTAPQGRALWLVTLPYVVYIPCLIGATITIVTAPMGESRILPDVCILSTDACFNAVVAILFFTSTTSFVLQVWAIAHLVRHHFALDSADTAEGSAGPRDTAVRLGAFGLVTLALFIATAVHVSGHGYHHHGAHVNAVRAATLMVSIMPLAVVLIFGSKMDILLALVCWRRAPAPRAVRRMSIEKLPLPRAGRDAV